MVKPPKQTPPHPPEQAESADLKSLGSSSTIECCYNLEKLRIVFEKGTR